MTCVAAWSSSSGASWPDYAGIFVGMCGIVGYVGKRPARELLLAGLSKLEYRGYDSAGISVIAEDRIESVRAVGNLSALQAKLAEGERGEDADASGAASVAVASRPATTGIGHTRWATHGRVSEENAHPHFDTTNAVHVVVNGIVENYVVLKRRLQDSGAVFTSETDAEVIAHLVAHHCASGTLAEAVVAAFNELVGHFAFVAMRLDEPDTIVGARLECPLVVGRGEGETFLASAIPAFLNQTRRVQHIENEEIVVVTAEDVRFLGADGVERERAVEEIDWSEETAEKGGFATFMLKEIHEQADAVADTVADRTAAGTHVDLDDVGALDEEMLRGIKRILITGCGTAYHAGLMGRYALEEWAQIRTDIDVASEYRYRRQLVGPGDLVIGMTQSGETADTLAAMRAARKAGATVLAVTNVVGSQATREANGVLYTRAGLEIGVAATKTFVCQVAVMYLLALKLAQLRGTMRPVTLEKLVGDIKRLPRSIAEVIEAATDPETGEPAGPVLAAAERDWEAGFFLYLGRHIGLAVALEGALKLKEISYINTDAYAAGEMKHGPIALLEEGTPVVVVATASPVKDKVVSNMQEVAARGAHVIAVAAQSDHEIDAHAQQVLRVPDVDWMLQPLLGTIPLQLLAYAIASKRGLNVDQPRNLAKTVTVE
jgi:glucosamine--fructose-6-phosphate aminotransferase (isomerizing)